jgi:Trp operon repressor
MARLRGRKLQIAMLLAAEGKMSDREIARHVGVKLRTFNITRGQPFFNKRVDEIRAELQRLPVREDGSQKPAPAMFDQQ